MPQPEHQVQTPQHRKLVFTVGRNNAKDCLLALMSKEVLQPIDLSENRMLIYCIHLSYESTFPLPGSVASLLRLGH